MTPDGIAEIDYFATRDEKVKYVLVWLGRQDKKAGFLRPHKIFDVGECEEVEK